MTLERQGTTTSASRKKNKASPYRPWVAVVWKDVIDDNNGSGVGKSATRNDADRPAPTRHEYSASGCEHVDLRKLSVP